MEKSLLHFSETTRFILTALGLFFLSLGGAALLFALIERIFFDLRGLALIVNLSLINIVIGMLLLLIRRGKSV